MADEFKIEYRTHKNGPLYITKPFGNFEDAQKHREFLLTQGNFDPVIKKECKDGHGHRPLSNHHSFSR